MRKFGRISVCGSISSYNDLDESKDKPKATLVQPAMVFNSLKMQGFIVHEWLDRWTEGIEKNLAWIKEGKIRYRETVTEGFENTYKAFTGMLKGENTGKAIIKV